MDQGPSSSQIFLFGSEKYVDNRASQSMKPIPIEDEPILVHVLDKVNNKLSTKFNSVLVDHYENRTTTLPYHTTRTTSWISPFLSLISATLSLGATGFMEFSRSRISGSRPSHRQKLLSNSLFVMDPVTQSDYYHRIARGTSSHHQLE